MKTEKQYFDDAIPLDVYMEKMGTHKENAFLIYNQFECPKDDEFIDILQKENPVVLVITEDWCGDAMLNNSILRKISEAASIDVRTVYRDEDTDLIDRHLTNGGRSIPVYLLLDQEGEILAKWGPRAPQLQEYVLGLKKGLPPTDAPEFSDKQKELLNRITSEYTSKPEYWLAVYEDIRKTFLPALQQMED